MDCNKILGNVARQVSASLCISNAPRWPINEVTCEFRMMTQLAVILNFETIERDSSLRILGQNHEIRGAGIEECGYTARTESNGREMASHRDGSREVKNQV